MSRPGRSQHLFHGKPSSNRARGQLKRFFTLTYRWRLCWDDSIHLTPWGNMFLASNSFCSQEARTGLPGTPIVDRCRSNGPQCCLCIDRNHTVLSKSYMSRLHVAQMLGQDIRPLRRAGAVGGCLWSCRRGSRGRDKYGR